MIRGVKSSCHVTATSTGRKQPKGEGNVFLLQYSLIYNILPDTVKQNNGKTDSMSAIIRSILYHLMCNSSCQKDSSQGLLCRERRSHVIFNPSQSRSDVQIN